MAQISVSASPNVRPLEIYSVTFFSLPYHGIFAQKKNRKGGAVA